jgi:hypothetical protein
VASTSCLYKLWSSCSRLPSWCASHSASFLFHLNTIEHIPSPRVHSFSSGAVGRPDLRALDRAQHAMVARGRQRSVFPLSLHQERKDCAEGLQTVRSRHALLFLALWVPTVVVRGLTQAWPVACRLSDTIAQIIYWQVIFGVFNLLNFLCKFVPVGTCPVHDDRITRDVRLTRSLAVVS